MVDAEEIPPIPDYGTWGPRRRMVRHAADLIGRNGVASTSIGDVLAASSAPRGSIYHHFPGGKTQLMTEAVRYAGEIIAARVDNRDAGSPGAAVHDIAQVWRRRLLATGYECGCSVLAGGMARRSEPAVADEAVAIVARWQRLVTSRLVGEGVEASRAEPLAVLVLSAIEGAVALCQTRSSTEPLDIVVAELAGVCEAAARTAR